MRISPLNKYFISPLLLTLFLQGCGGSSSDTPPPPVEPVEYTFTLSAQLTNDCGVASAFTDVELLLQDDTWQTLNSYKADENGQISFVTESEFINYTIVAKNQQGSEAEGLNVVSFYQANSATPSHYQAQFDGMLDGLNEKNCECVTQNIELSHRTFDKQTSVTSSLGDVSWVAIDSKTTLLEGIKVCKALDGNWPLHSFSVLGTDSNQKSIVAGGFKDDFSDNVDGLWLLAADEVADSIELVMPHQTFNTNQLIGNTKHFSMLIAEDEESLLVFDTHSHISEAYYQSQARVTFNGGDFFWGSSVIENYQQIISTSAQESLAVKVDKQIPAIDVDNHSEIKADGNYDYSAVVGYPMAVISYDFTTYDPTTKLLMPAKWTFYGAEKGVLAISGPLTGYEDIINISTNKKATEVELIKSIITNNYQDYIKHYQGKSALDMNVDFVKKIKKVEITYKLN